MKSGVIKFVGVMFIIFLIVGNLSAPPEVRGPEVQIDNPILKAMYHAGEFIVVPFKTVKYKLSNTDINTPDINTQPDKSELAIPEPFDKGKSLPYKYKVVEGIKVYFIPYPKGEAFKPKEWERRDGRHNWPFDYKQLYQDVNSEFVRSIILKDLNESVLNIQRFFKEDVEKWGIDGVPIEDLRYMVSWWRGEMLKGGETKNAFLPSESFKRSMNKQGVDCKSNALVQYAIIYNVNKYFGVEADYYLGIIDSPKAPVMHDFLLVYYPDEGLWEVYDWGYMGDYFGYRFPTLMDAIRFYISEYFIDDYYGKGGTVILYRLPDDEDPHLYWAGKYEYTPGEYTALVKYPINVYPGGRRDVITDYGWYHYYVKYECGWVVRDGCYEEFLVWLREEEEREKSGEYGSSNSPLEEFGEWLIRGLDKVFSVFG